MPQPKNKLGPGPDSNPGGGAPGEEDGSGARCRVCSGELAGGECPYCRSSEKIQKALLEIGEVRGRGINVDESTELLQRARELLEERDFSNIDDFLSSARHFAKEADAVQGPLRKALDKASAALRALKRSGRDTHRLEQAILRAERFLSKGEYEGARLLIRRIPAFIRELQGPPVLPPDRPSTPAYITSCPNCSKHVMMSWRKCPHCLAALREDGPAPQ
jgi:hypothetical protein